MSSTDAVVILTALNVEYAAVRAKMRNLRVHWHPAGTRFEVGRLGPHGGRAILGLVGKGNHPAAVLAERAIAEFSPSAVLFVGVAGALKPTVELGDVVVASQVYAYHGGRADDDGLKARPRGWEISHQAGQIAQHVMRTGGWATDPLPKVHFGPIAAGEVVQDSLSSEHARWVRQHYNDALAIEMEAAGVAQAAHLNRALPIVVVRGISDRADGSKTATDGESWQERAVAHAADFAEALARELVAQGAGSHRQRDEEESPRMGTAATFSNIAMGNARVGAQFGQVHGNVTLGTGSRRVDVAAEIAALRGAVRQAYQDGRLDDATATAAQAELEVASESVHGSHDRLAVSLKKVRGLVDETADIAAQVTAVIASVRGLT
jgi:adenosylhomocysteine nucleosidase